MSAGGTLVVPGAEVGNRCVNPSIRNYIFIFPFAALFSKIPTPPLLLSLRQNPSLKKSTFEKKSVEMRTLVKN